MGLMARSKQYALGSLSRIVASALLVLFVSSCAQEPVPQDTFYRLGAPVAEASGGAVFKGILEVERFAADGLNGGRPIVYSRAEAPLQINEYHYHFWVEPPAVMLQDRIVTYIRAAELAKTVVMPEMRVEPDFILSGRILRFEQVLGSGAEVAISLEIGVRAVASDQILLIKTYEQRQPADDASVASAVRAFDTAFADILANIGTDLREL